MEVETDVLAAGSSTVDIQSNELTEFSSSEDLKPDLSTIFSSSAGIKTELLTFYNSQNIKLDMTFKTTQDVKPDVTPDFSSSADIKTELLTFINFQDIKPDMSFKTSQDVKPDVNSEFSSSNDIKPELSFFNVQDIKPNMSFNNSQDVKFEITCSIEKNNKKPAASAVFSTSENLKPELSTTENLKEDFTTEFLSFEDKQENGLEENLQLSGDNGNKIVYYNPTFSQSSKSNMHKIVHSEDKPYKCEVCLKRFSQSFHLREHKNVHSGERPHECDVCYKRFSQSSHLRDHKMVHSGERPHECDFISKKLSSMEVETDVLAAVSSTVDIQSNELTEVSSSEDLKPDLSTIFSSSADIKSELLTFINFQDIKPNITLKKIHSNERPHDECDVCPIKFAYWEEVKNEQKEWIITETWAKIEDRKEIKQKINKCKDEKEKINLRTHYCEVNRMVRKSAKEDKRQFIQEMIAEAETAARQGKMKRLYEVTRTLSVLMPQNSPQIKCFDGNRLDHAENHKKTTQESSGVSPKGWRILILSMTSAYYLTSINIRKPN
ncbi:zinc finger protein 436-like [Physella acuta]|uniref:zinc finger protein 436-like n=1 Tax=Physella acuta TaxID=109671 RepID=UPI0027DAFB20|nr:zinc finger protein 436-like [Physella acuta]